MITHLPRTHLISWLVRVLVAGERVNLKVYESSNG